MSWSEYELGRIGIYGGNQSICQIDETWVIHSQYIVRGNIAMNLKSNLSQYIPGTVSIKDTSGFVNKAYQDSVLLHEKVSNYTSNKLFWMCVDRRGFKHGITGIYSEDTLPGG